jgi:hypothetical protein
METKNMVKHTTIPEMHDVVRILTDVALALWEAHKDDGKITFAELFSILVGKIPVILREVDLNALVKEIETFKLKEQNAFISGPLLNMIWTMAYGGV